MLVVAEKCPGCTGESYNSRRQSSLRIVVGLWCTPTVGRSVWCLPLLDSANSEFRLLLLAAPEQKLLGPLYGCVGGRIT